VLHGEARGQVARYEGVSVPGLARDLGALGAVIAAGDELTLGDDVLLVRRDGADLARFTRTDPGLGLLAPFGRTA
jgi:hypothetical protein